MKYVSAAYLLVFGAYLLTVAVKVPALRIVFGLPLSLLGWGSSVVGYATSTNVVNYLTLCIAMGISILVLAGFTLVQLGDTSYTVGYIIISGVAAVLHGVQLIRRRKL